MSWYLGRMCGFDLETTGVDPEKDRIVTACVVPCGQGIVPEPLNWLADPGVDIPEGAAKVHGITTDHARTKGRPAADVIAEIVEALASAADIGLPIIAMNASFDLTMLDREARRHGITPLTEIVRAVDLARIPVRVVDPRVLDKQVDQYRRGGRTLTDLCKHYQVPLDGAHAADADAIAACRVAWRIASVFPKVGELSLHELHAQQVEWAREQAESLADYFRRTPGKESWADGVRGDWPLIPFEAAGA